MTVVPVTIGWVVCFVGAIGPLATEKIADIVLLALNVNSNQRLNKTPLFVVVTSEREFERPNKTEIYFKRRTGGRCYYHGARDEKQQGEIGV